MHRLPILTSKALVRILKNFGFQLDHITGSHFIFYNPRTHKRTTIPYHFKDLPKGTLINILREAGISKKDLEKYQKRK